MQAIGHADAELICLSRIAVMVIIVFGVRVLFCLGIGVGNLAALYPEVGQIAVVALKNHFLKRLRLNKIAFLVQSEFKTIFSLACQGNRIEKSVHGQDKGAAIRIAACVVCHVHSPGSHGAVSKVGVICLETADHSLGKTRIFLWIRVDFRCAKAAHSGRALLYCITVTVLHSHIEDILVCLGVPSIRRGTSVGKSTISVQNKAGTIFCF